MKAVRVCVCVCGGGVFVWKGCMDGTCPGTYVPQPSGQVITPLSSEVSTCRKWEQLQFQSHKLALSIKSASPTSDLS